MSRAQAARIAGKSTPASIASWSEPHHRPLISIRTGRPGARQDLTLDEDALPQDAHSPRRRFLPQAPVREPRDDPPLPPEQEDPLPRAPAPPAPPPPPPRA